MPGTLLSQLLAAVGAAALLAAVGAYGGCRYKQDEWDKAVAAQRAHAEKTTAQQQTDSTSVEVRYVDRVKEVKVPVVQIRDRLVRSCPAGSVRDAGSAAGQPGAGRGAGEPVDAAAPADAGDGLLGAVAAEIPACVANGIQLDELQSLICANADPKAVARLKRSGRLQCR